MIQVSIQEAEKNIAEILAKVEKAHERVEISREGKTFARIIPTISEAKKNEDPFKTNPKFHVNIMEDPTLPMDPEDFPTL